MDLESTARRLQADVRQLVRAAALLRFDVDEVRVTLFVDGRALIEGTSDPARALAVYDRWIGA
jgi:adenylyltransferase/sulfurtransferase